ncbi:B3 domain-containing protein At3g18960 [Linum grandiflorum]
MASSSQAKRGEEVTRFFRIILQHAIVAKKLMIPRKFISENGQQLLGCDAATLEVPTGDKWDVGLETDRRGFVWFCSHGWEEFTEFYSLDIGHFLLFQYKGHSANFSVVICDRSAVEIDYPTLSRAANVGRAVEIESEDDSLSVEILDDVDAAANKRDVGKGKAPMRIPFPFTNEHSFLRDVEQVMLEVGDKVWPVRLSVENDKHVSLGANWILFAKENSLQLGDVCFFKLVTTSPDVRMKRIPFSFTKKHSFMKDMKPLKLEVGDKVWPVTVTRSKDKYHLGGGWIGFAKDNSLNLGDRIPFSFTKKHSFMKYMKPLKLEVGDKVWPVTVTRSKDKYHLGGGWIGFAKGNSLNLGDVCIFKLITKSPDVRMKVTVIRATLEVPTGDKWEVGLKMDRKGSFWFCNRRWEEFTEFYLSDHGRHYLLFEYKGHSDFSVFISAEIDYPTLSRAVEEDSLSVEILDDVDAAANKRDVAKGKAPMVDDAYTIPFHKGTLVSERCGAGHAGGRGQGLAGKRIPFSFTKEHSFMKDVKQLKLEVGDTVWPVTVTRSKDKYHLGGGWIRFAKDNSLNLGDVCVFKLITESPDVRMKVTVIRVSTTGFPLQAQEERSMASSGKKKAIRFFTIIYQSTIRNKKLMIPKKFISLFGQQLLGCDAATLEVPTGDKWEVGLKRDRKGSFWFCNRRWEQFAEFYLSGHGRHYLLFKYKGRSSFSVSISAEIAYQTLTRAVEEDDDVDADAYEESPLGSGHRLFKIKIQPSHLNPRKQPRIPFSFTKKHSFMRDAGKLELKVGDNAWPVNIWLERDRYVRIGAGWGDFVKENSLELGDLCVFKLVTTSPDIRMEVTINRGG